MPSWLDLPLFLVTLIVMLVGLFGLLVPIFPGLVRYEEAVARGAIRQFASPIQTIQQHSIAQRNLDDLLALTADGEGGLAVAKLDSV